MTDPGMMRQKPEKNSLTPTSADRGHAYQGGDTWTYTVSSESNGTPRLTIASAIDAAGFETGDKVTVTRLERGRIMVERVDDSEPEEERESHVPEWADFSQRGEQ